MQKYLLNIDTALLTPRTVVRRFREKEGVVLYELIQDNHSRIADHFPHTLKEIKSKTDAEFYIRHKFAAWLLQEEFCFGIWDNNSAKLIGFIRIFSIDWHVPKAEISFFVDQKYAQKGIMTEALYHTIKFIFEQLKVEKLVMRTATDNYAAQRLARKCGLRREGDLRGDFRKLSGELIDLMLFGLTKAEFEKV